MKWKKCFTSIHHDLHLLRLLRLLKPFNHQHPANISSLIWERLFAIPSDTCLSPSTSKELMTMIEEIRQYLFMVWMVPSTPDYLSD